MGSSTLLGVVLLLLAIVLPLLIARVVTPLLIRRYGGARPEDLDRLRAALPHRGDLSRLRTRLRTRRSAR